MVGSDRFQRARATGYIDGLTDTPDRSGLFEAEERRAYHLGYADGKNCQHNVQVGV